jgi:hypothetical protein
MLTGRLKDNDFHKFRTNDDARSEVEIWSAKQCEIDLSGLTHKQGVNGRLGDCFPNTPHPEPFPAACLMNWIERCPSTTMDFAVLFLMRNQN